MCACSAFADSSQTSRQVRKVPTADTVDVPCFSIFNSQIIHAPSRQCFTRHQDADCRFGSCAIDGDECSAMRGPLLRVFDPRRHFGRRNELFRRVRIKGACEDDQSFIEFLASKLPRRCFGFECLGHARARPLLHQSSSMHFKGDVPSGHLIVLGLAPGHPNGRRHRGHCDHRDACFNAE